MKSRRCPNNSSTLSCEGPKFKITTRSECKHECWTYHIVRCSVRTNPQSFHSACKRQQAPRGFWSCKGAWYRHRREGRAGGPQVVRLMAYIRAGGLWERTEASVSMQKHKHAAIATHFPFQGFAVLLFSNLSRPQNAAVTEIQASEPTSTLRLLQKKTKQKNIFFNNNNFCLPRLGRIDETTTPSTKKIQHFWMLRQRQTEF